MKNKVKITYGLQTISNAFVHACTKAKYPNARAENAVAGSLDKQLITSKATKLRIVISTDVSHDGGTKVTICEYNCHIVMLQEIIKSVSEELDGLTFHVQ